MSRRNLSRLAASLIAVATPVGVVAAQTAPPSTAVPDPKLPPMPSMEGQQGDLGKPVTERPRKPAPSQRRSPAAMKVGRPGAKPRKTKH